MRVPTSDGIAWFKEDPPGDEFEPALTELLARRRPDCLPELIAWEGRRMLTRHVGERLRAVHDSGGTRPSWGEVLSLYAEIQIAFMDLADRALALGTPDDRPERLPAQYEELAGGRDDLFGALEDAGKRLRGSIPLTVAHMEAHDGNIFVRDGRPVFIDWAEAVVTHPFVGPLQALRCATERLGYEPGSAEVERLRDLYLEPFTRFASMDELRELFAAGYLLHGVSRARLWQRTLERLPVDAQAEYGEPVAAWFGILRKLVDGRTLLGAA